MYESILKRVQFKKKIGKYPTNLSWRFSFDVYLTV